LGAYIEATFDIDYRVTKFDVYQREKEDDRISKMKICFGKQCEHAESFILKNSLGKQTFELEEPQQATKVRLQIEGVFGQGKAGGMFNIWGIPCVSNDDPALKTNEPGGGGAPPSKPSPNKVYDLQCEDSIESNDDLMGAKYVKGDVFRIKCEQACGSKKEIQIFGTNTYSADSSLCKAAVHSGAIPNEDNQNVKVSLVACPAEFESKNTDADPIISLSKAGCGNDEYAINFIPADIDEMAVKVVKVGRLVDVEVDGKWSEGVVKIVDVVTPR
jgi:hypothetical protein